MAYKKDRYTKEQLAQMDVAKELLINRYLLNTVISNLYRINRCMVENFEYLLKHIDCPKKGKPIKKKEIARSERVQFEKFSITNEQYNALVNEYGVEVVTEACVILDGYLKTKSRDLKDNYKKLKQWAIHIAMKNRLSDVRQDIEQITSSIDVRDIGDVVTARKYINSVPSHIRNVDNDVKYLIDKFNIR